MSGEVLIGVLAALQLLWLFSDAEIVLHPVRVPMQLDEAGFSSEALTATLQDDLRTIVLNSRGTHATVPTGIVEKNLAETIAEVLHIEEPMRKARSLLEETTFEVAMEFVTIEDEIFLEARIVRMPYGPSRQEMHAVDPARIFDAVYDAAKWVLRNVDPLTLAKFQYQQAQKTGDYQRVLKEVDASRLFYEKDMYPLIDNLEGAVQLGRGDPAAALTLFRQALSRRPAFPEARLNLALALAGTGAIEEAEATLLELSDPSRLDFWNVSDTVRGAAFVLQGLIAAHEGRTDEALVLMRRGIAMAPEMAVLHEIFAGALEDSGLGTIAQFHRAKAQHLDDHQAPVLPRTLFSAKVMRQLLPPGGAAAANPAMAAMQGAAHVAQTGP